MREKRESTKIKLKLGSRKGAIPFSLPRVTTAREEEEREEGAAAERRRESRGRKRALAGREGKKGKTSEKNKYANTEIHRMKKREREK